VAKKGRVYRALASSFYYGYILWILYGSVKRTILSVRTHHGNIAQTRSVAEQRLNVTE
jgi:hypothetical protein